MRRFIAVCTLAAAAVATTYASSADAAPLNCPSNDVNAGPAVVSSSVLTTDPVQKGHLYVGGAAAPATPSTCAAPKMAPAVAESAADFHYKAHTFKNRSTATACVDARVVFTGSALGTGFHETTAYLGSFDPSDPAKNYLGDSGHNDGGPDVRAFSVNVPAMADFVLVSTWSGPATPGYEPKYDLYVAGCGQVVVTGITPNVGPIEGGQSITISGSGFQFVNAGALSAWIGDRYTNTVFTDDSTLSGVTLPAAAGTYDVTVTAGQGPDKTLVATLPQAYTYSADAGADAADAGSDASADAGDAGTRRDASTGGPTQGGPTQGSSSSGGATDDSDDDEGDDASAGDGGAKRVSAPTKRKTGGDEEYVCACNEVGKSTTPGLGAFATLALGILAVLRLKKRRS